MKDPKDTTALKRKPKGAGKEISDTEKLPLVYCAKCHKYQLARIDTMVKGKGKGKITVNIVSCAVCDIVANFDKLPKIKWLTYAEFKKKGYGELFEYKGKVKDEG
jgi:hypothetical protein